jgi:hypothetical protein
MLETRFRARLTTLPCRVLPPDIFSSFRVETSTSRLCSVRMSGNKQNMFGYFRCPSMGFLNHVFFFGEPEKEWNFLIWQNDSHSCE